MNLNAKAAARTNIDQPFVKLVTDCAAEAFGTELIISVSSARTGPMHSFVKMLDAPCISVGSTFIYTQIYSTNEFARTDLLNKATKCIAAIIEKFGRTSYAV